MATLQAIRNKAGLLALIIGLALFAFIIGDFLNSGSSLFRQSQRKIAKIGDSSLDYKDYENRILEMEEVYKIQTGQSTLNEAISGQIRESVYESIVRERLLDEQSELLGVTVTGKELFSMINGANIHPMIQQLPIFRNPQTGMFDRSIMMNFLRTIEKDDLSQYPAEAQEQIAKLKKYWMFWENSLKYTRLEEKLNALLIKAVQANSLDAKTAYADRSINVDLQYVFQPYAALPDSNYEISKGDVKKRYKTQKERFVQKPYRSAKYVVVDVKPSKKDYSEVETAILGLEGEFSCTTDLKGFVNQNSDESYLDCYVSDQLLNETLRSFVHSSVPGSFMKPVFSDGAFVMARLIDKTVAADSVKARQIVLPENDKALADSILDVLHKGGDFMALAAKYSKGSGNPEMGWFREVDVFSLGADFVRSCFGAPVNAVFSVKTRNALSIVQVTEKTAPVAKSKIAVVSMKVTPSSATYSSVYNKLNRVVASNPNAPDFFAAAAKAGYEVQDAQIVRSSDNTLAAIPQMRQAVRFVYNNDVNDLSSILENQSNQFVVVGITGISDGDYETVEVAGKVLERELINDQKAVTMCEDWKTKNANTLADLAQKTGLKVDTARFVTFGTRNINGIGDEPALVAAVSQATVNKLAGPVRGKNGVYMFQPISKIKSQEVFDAKKEKASWNGMNMYRIVYQSLEPVRKATKIMDSRIRFY